MNEIQAAVAGHPARQAEVEASVMAARKAWEQEQARLDSNERERRQLESLLGMERDKVKKWEGRLGEIRTPREYAALSREIEIAKKRAVADEKLAALAVRRGEAGKLVDPGLLAKYENIKRRRAGVAIAPVVGMTCKGCHRNVPPQLAITLQKANSIETCPNCHRIIYSAEAVNPAASSPA